MNTRESCHHCTHIIKQQESKLTKWATSKYTCFPLNLLKIWSKCVAHI